MFNYNSSILLQCFQDKLPCIWGVYAILRENTNEKMINYKTPESTIPIVKSSDVNYFKHLPYEIILLIINNLYDNDIMHFCIAIQQCDKKTLNKLAFWYDIYCWGCENITLKYYYCWDCQKKLCPDCVQKCSCCEDMIDNCCYTVDYLNCDKKMATFPINSHTIKTLMDIIH
jgi:hypothetical protein